MKPRPFSKRAALTETDLRTGRPSEADARTQPGSLDERHRAGIPTGDLPVGVVEASGP